MTKTMLLAVALLGFWSTAFAEMPKEGKYDYMACWSGTRQASKFSDTHSMVSYDFSGIIHANPPGGAFDKEIFHCIGIELIADGKVISGSNLCEATDKDGNKRLARFSAADGKVVREQVVGTGKYEGLTLTPDTIAPLGPFPALKEGTTVNCNHQTGTYKLK